MHMKHMLTAAAAASVLALGAAETKINAIGEKSRDEIYAFFADNVYGRRPKAAEKPAILRFEKTSDDKVLADAGIVVRQARVVYGGPYGTNSRRISRRTRRGLSPRSSTSADGSPARTEGSA